MNSQLSLRWYLLCRIYFHCQLYSIIFLKARYIALSCPLPVDAHVHVLYLRIVCQVVVSYTIILEVLLPEVKHYKFRPIIIG